MAQTVFVSPGVYTREQDFTFFASRIGITRLGMVGLTLKGPAFEPIKVSSQEDFLNRFGGTNPDYPLPYVAQAFLGQSSELTMTRVLGKVGFTNSPAWIIGSPNSGVFSGSTSQSGMTFNGSATVSNTLTINTIEDYIGGVSGDVSGSTTGGNTVNINFSGSATLASYKSVFNSVAASLGASVTGGVDTDLLNTDTFSLAITNSVPNQSSGLTFCVIRSKKDPVTGQFYYTGGSATIVATGLGLPLGQFTISGGSNTKLSALTNNELNVSLDETQKNYIVNSLGKNPKNVPGDYGLFVDVVTPHFVRQAWSAGTLSTLSGLTFTNDVSFTDYTSSYSNSRTPMIVSKVVGADVRDLFYIETISDGNASANEIKVSIANIDDINKVFDVVVRRFDDTDANTLTQGRLELFRGLTLDDTQPNFIGRAIGTTDEVYPRQSKYITITLADNFPRFTVPAGFRGYPFRIETGSTIGQTPILYKTGYTTTDTVSKTYLGISELAYDKFTPNLVGQKIAIKSVEKDLFKFQGEVTSGITTSLGFHMESGATNTLFVTGEKGAISDYTKAQAKFTIAPYGGFDGWDQFVDVTFTDDFNDQSNVQAFKDAVDLMAVPETVDINLFATPDCDWYNHYTAVDYGLSMIQNRADAVYVIDSPRYASDGSQDTAAIATDLQGVGLDSNYAATYWPWIQIFDPTFQQFVFTSPTAQVVKSIALTDNVAYPWFAPAGLTRGKVDCVKADVKLTRDDRDNLYDVNINPINTTIQEGVTIQGQKTLQVKQSALDRINVRRLLLQVRRLIAAASQTLLFEPNDQTVRDQFLAKVEPLLLQIQNQRGLAGFRVVVDDFNNASIDSDRNTLTGKIQIKPTPALEFIDLTFQVLPTGANFEDF
jgi:hypothetical protein